MRSSSRRAMGDMDRFPLQKKSIDKPRQNRVHQLGPLASRTWRTALTTGGAAGARVAAGAACVRTARSAGAGFWIGGTLAFWIGGTLARTVVAAASDSPLVTMRGCSVQARCGPVKGR